MHGLPPAAAAERGRRRVRHGLDDRDDLRSDSYWASVEKLASRHRLGRIVLEMPLEEMHRPGRLHSGLGTLTGLLLPRHGPRRIVRASDSYGGKRSSPGGVGGEVALAVMAEGRDGSLAEEHGVGGGAVEGDAADVEAIEAAADQRRAGAVGEADAIAGGGDGFADGGDVGDGAADRVGDGADRTAELALEIDAGTAQLVGE